jgi:tripartite-type tricarboxylate transporter receptor subunit TctC
MVRTLRNIGLGLALAITASLPLPASSQPYPSKPIRMVAPYPPGASIDIVARLLGQKMGESMGQAFVIDNKAGASGAIGSEFLARSAPDGYTIGFGNPSTHVLPVALRKKMQYDAVKDFTPISAIAKNILAIAVHPSLPVRNIRELVDYAKHNPGKISYGTPGAGTSHHLIGEMLNEVAGTDMLHVGYRGGGPAITDLLSGQIPMGIASLTTVTPYVKNGRTRIIAILDDRRYSDLPDIPTGIESFPGFEAKASWTGLFGPAGMPPEIVNRIYTEMRKALADPEVKKKLEANGFEIIASTPAEFRTFLDADIALWSRIARARNIKTE